MDKISFADVSQQQLSFSKDNPSEKLVLDLIDTPWIQRLRNVSQTANVKLVYMFSEHSRFGHSLGVAYLACQVMRHLSNQFGSEIEPYKTAVAVAALLHDVGHIAPGSHVAQFAWFPNDIDRHEETSNRIIKNSPEIRSVVNDPTIIENVTNILAENSSVPPWTWEIISGGGWNVDRGNWCIIDSVLSGVLYGKYNIAALTEAIVLTKDKHLALKESRLDAMLHFAISRQAMYSQIYQHRVILAADKLLNSVIKRARYLLKNENTSSMFMDETMRKVLNANSVNELSIDDIFNMVESWFAYHLRRWTHCDDKILSDLANRYLNRHLFKTVRVGTNDNYNNLYNQAKESVIKCGYDPEYYLFDISTKDVNKGDANQSMLVQMDNNEILSLSDAEPLFNSMLNISKNESKRWLIMPEDAKKALGRTR